MKKIILPVVGTSLLALGFLAQHFTQPPHRESDACENPEPLDYLWAQRAYPFGFIPADAYRDALAFSKNLSQERGGGLFWELAGPTNVSGRITDLAMYASDTLTIYAATASGGVWKSDDAGENWFPITDELPSLSIGDIAIDPSDKKTIYVGTGEPNAGGGSLAYDGQGVFKSTDAGQSWVSLGLENSGSIGRIEVDPANPNRIFVAAMGNLFSNNSERGIFRSEDGGLSWEKTLFVNDSTGGIDLAIHPLHPDTVFAVTWQRIRRPNKRMYGGPGCGIWRSVDGGDTWTKLSQGLPASNIGRIGIALSTSQPNILYALYADEIGFFKGVFKSQDNGDNWALLSGGDPEYPGFGWWFGQIRVHPNDADEVYTLGLDWQKTTDGGQNWTDVSEYLHADYHALYIHPEKPDFHVVGNDGGIYISTNAGANWDFSPIPITQFYTSEIDFQNPTNYYGGAQDNGTWRTLTGNLDDWQHIAGGDGFVTLVNPLNSNLYYAESQYGGFFGTNGASAPSSDRYNWNTPYIFDPNNPDIMYFGAEKLFKSTDAGLNWTAISNDLSNGPTGQNGIRYGTITTIAASAIVPGPIWVGTDDGNVWVTSNGGGNWSKVSASLPKRWVTRVVAMPTSQNDALVCLSGFRHFDNMAHIYLTNDKGQSWKNVSGNLPDIPVNDLVLDPADPYNVWYVATDAGVFSTTDGGENWFPSNAGLPLVPVLDLTIHAPTRTMVAATYGRSMFHSELPPPASTTLPVSIQHLRVAPNPFSQEVQISFSNSQKQRVKAEMFALSGKKIKTIFEGELATGPQQIKWEGSDLPSGVYLLRIESEQGASVCRKLLKQ